MYFYPYNQTPKLMFWFHCSISYFHVDTNYASWITWYCSGCNCYKTLKQKKCNVLPHMTEELKNKFRQGWIQVFQGSCPFTQLVWAFLLVGFICRSMLSISWPLPNVQCSKSRSKKSPLSQKISELLSLISLPGLGFLGHEHWSGQSGATSGYWGFIPMKTPWLGKRAWFPKKDQGVATRRNGVDMVDMGQAKMTFYNTCHLSPVGGISHHYPDHRHLDCFQRGTRCSGFTSNICLSTAATLGQESY